MMHKILVAGALSLGLAGVLGASAHAQLVTNGGFEADPTNPVGWTVGGGGNAGVDQLFPNSGSNDAFISSDFSTGLIPTTLSQMIIGLTPNADYVVDFFIASSDVDTTSTFDATMASFSAPTITADEIPAGSYLPVSFDITPASSSETLQFTAADSVGNFWLDDVSVNAVGVPEPMSALLFASAAAAFSLVRRRRA